MSMLAGLVGDHIDVTETGIGYMVNGGQDDTIAHGLNGEGGLDGG